MIKYLTPFFTSFAITVFFSFLAVFLAKKYRIVGRVSKHHIHRKGISRLGGLIMVLAFNGALFLNPDLVMTPELYGFSIGTLALLVVGFWDDLKELYWKIQLFIQTAVSVLVFIIGVRIYYVTNPLTGGIIDLDSGLGVIISAILVVVWLLVVLNVVNWSDGIDGLSGGVTFITASTIFFLSFRPEVNQPPVAIISAALMGTVLGFLIFNFHPSRILAGTAGSMFMGFSLAVLAIFAGTKIATALLVLSIPTIDFLWVIGERWKNKRSIFMPDKNHIHHKLMELGWSQKKIVFYYWLVTIVIASIALNTRVVGKSLTLAAVAVFMILLLIFINKKLKSAHRDAKR